MVFGHAVNGRDGRYQDRLAPGVVAQGDRHGICMVVIPSDAELDLKTIAAASDNRKIHLVPVKELQKLTGYIRGGVPAIAAKKAFPVYADNSIERFGLISVSAGTRALQILLSPVDYLRVVNARLASIATCHGRFPPRFKRSRAHAYIKHASPLPRNARFPAK